MLLKVQATLCARVHSLKLKSNFLVRKGPTKTRPRILDQGKRPKLRFFFVSKAEFFIFLLWSQRGPQASEISASNKLGKIGLYEVRAQKSATFDPPKPRPQNLA